MYVFSGCSKLIGFQVDDLKIINCVGRCCGLTPLAAKDHMAALSPLPVLGWGGEWEEEGKTCGPG